MVVASRTIVAFLCLLLVAGCAQIKAVFTPTPSPHVPARPASPPLRLSPQVSSDREIQLTEEVNATIQRVERTLLSIDRQKLRSDQWETYQTIHSFLTQAREALTTKDLQRAMNLGQKAHVLSDELSKMVR